MLIHRLRRHVRPQPLALTTYLLVMIAAVWPLAAVRAATDPVLSLEPDRAPCTGRIVVRGRHFPPGQVISLVAFLPGGGRATEIARATVPTDGILAIGVEVREFVGACDSGPAQRDGTRYIINAVRTQGSSQDIFLATATFILSSSPATTPGLPNTGGGGAQSGALLAAEPILTLEPDHAPCASRVVMRGTSFPPGQAIQLGAIQTTPPNHQGVIFARTTVAVDGTFIVEAEMRLIVGPCVSGQAASDETQFTIYAGTDEGNPGRSTFLATATFTVSSSSTPIPDLPNTGGGGAQIQALPPLVLPVSGGLIAVLGGVGLHYVQRRRRVG